MVAFIDRGSAGMVMMLKELTAEISAELLLLVDQNLKLHLYKLPFIISESCYTNKATPFV